MCYRLLMRHKCLIHISSAGHGASTAFVILENSYGSSSAGSGATFAHLQTLAAHLLQTPGSVAAAGFGVGVAGFGVGVAGAAGCPCAWAISWTKVAIAARNADGLMPLELLLAPAVRAATSALKAWISCGCPCAWALQIIWHMVCILLSELCWSPCSSWAFDACMAWARVWPMVATALLKVSTWAAGSVKLITGQPAFLSPTAMLPCWGCWWPCCSCLRNLFQLAWPAAFQLAAHWVLCSFHHLG